MEDQRLLLALVTAKATETAVTLLECPVSIRLTGGVNLVDMGHAWIEPAPAARIAD